MRSTPPASSPARISATLFSCLFASQAAILVIAPILPDVARDLGVSTATVGQLRAVSGAAGGVAALAIGFLLGGAGLRTLLRAGLLLVAGGSLASAIAPGFAVLAAAQVAIGAGSAAILAGGVAAAVEWAPPGRGVQVLAWAIVGQPAAWVVGMPVAGLVGELSWRLTWLAVPLAATLIALAALRLTAAGLDAPATTPATGGRDGWRDRKVIGWALGELLASSAWAGTLVYAGVLLIDSYRLSAGTVSLLLGASALAYFPGTFAARRLPSVASPRLLAAMALVLAGGVALFGAARPGAGVSTAIFAALVLTAGARSLVASWFGMHAAPEHRIAVMSLRAASMQFGYLIGAGLGGLALAAGGYAMLGTVLATLFALAAVPHVVPALGRRRSGEPSRRAHARDPGARAPGRPQPEATA